MTALVVPADGAPRRRQYRRNDSYRPSSEAVARILMLIDTFSRGSGRSRRAGSLEGRTKLAKLDFFVRYPDRLAVALRDAGASEEEVLSVVADQAPIEQKMIRYRYGPWDPSYFAILGALVGQQLIEVVPLGGRKGNGYRTTEAGHELATQFYDDESWHEITRRMELLRKHLNKSGDNLKKLVYDTFPDIAGSHWGQKVT
jgi:hypothetical protein